MKDISHNIWKGGCYSVPIGMRGVSLPWGIKPSGSGRERVWSGGGRGGRGGESGNTGGGGLLRFFIGGGEGCLRIGAARANRVQVTRDELGDV